MGAKKLKNKHKHLKLVSLTPKEKKNISSLLTEVKKVIKLLRKYPSDMDLLQIKKQDQTTLKRFFRKIIKNNNKEFLGCIQNKDNSKQDKKMIGAGVGAALGAMKGSAGLAAFGTAVGIPLFIPGAILGYALIGLGQSIKGLFDSNVIEEMEDFINGQEDVFLTVEEILNFVRKLQKVCEFLNIK